MKLLVTTPAPGLTRRSFIAGAAATTLAASSGDILGAATGGPVIVTSWDFGPGANAIGWPIIERGGLAIDAVEAAMGDDATRFAVSKGFVETSLTNAASQAAWQAWMDEGGRSDAWDPEPIGQGAPPQGHDTVGCMAMDIHGNVCVGCSTNGRNFKLPGRVGDSPITGAGALCDNDVGAARGYRFDGAVVALRKDCFHGGAKRGWADEEFRYAVHDAAGAKHLLVT